MNANALRRSAAAALMLGAIAAAPTSATALTGRAALTASPARHYVARPDYRRCISPLCGGYWLRSVNERQTRCHDGTRADECYVGGIDAAALGLDDADRQAFTAALSAGKAVALGVQVSGSFDGFPDVASLTIRAAWTAATDAAPSGVYVGLADTGVVCITHPCFNIEESVLNRRRTRTISSVDLSGAGATSDQLAAAQAALASGDLVAAGHNRRVRNAGPAGQGIEFRARQFYLPVRPSPLPGPSCGDCAASEICIDDPADSCTGCGCPTTCASVESPFCGGFAGIACPAGLTCVDDPGDSCDPDCGGADCGGFCVAADDKPAFCGGFAGFTCPMGQSCLETAGDGCSAMCGGADCGGSCYGLIGDACGGIAGIPCGAGLACVDPLGDGCDAACGGADCGGVCVVAGSGG